MIPAVQPARADIDVLQYSIRLWLLAIANGEYATTSPVLFFFDFVLSIIKLINQNQNQIRWELKATLSVVTCY